MIGFRSVQHQGWSAAKRGEDTRINPYPGGSVARSQYASGQKAFAFGQTINRQGEVEGDYARREPEDY